MIFLEADPEPIGIDFTKAGILVVDMQNAFASKGGYFDLMGTDLSPTERIIPCCRKIINAGRKKGLKIIYLQMGYSKYLSDRGSKDSPATLKSRVHRMLDGRPDLREKLFIYDTWGTEIIEELKPLETDIIVRKQRYDGFIGTNLDLILRTLGLKTLLFIGTATNICIESTLRHAFFLDYFSILISDAVSPAGDAAMQEATLRNVRSNFGWVATSSALLDALGTLEACSPMEGS